MLAKARRPVLPLVQRRRVSLRWLPLWILLAVVIFMTAYPTALVFLNSFQHSRPGEPVVFGLDSWRAALSDRSIVSALANTFVLAAIRSVLASGMAVFFCWVVTRTDMPFRGVIEYVLWLGCFFPLLPMAMGWILLLDPQYGLINQVLMGLFGLSAPPFDIYSYGGIVWAHLAYSTSIRFLLITPAFRAMDAALEEAAKTSGASGGTTLWRITVPILAPAIFAATALGFIKSLQSFETEMILGLPVGIYVYSTKIWDYIHWEPPEYGPATVLSTVFLLAILAMVWLQRTVLGRRHYTTVTGRGYSVRPASLGRWRWVMFGFCVLWIAVMILLPLTFLIMGTFMRRFGFFELEDAWTVRHWLAAFDDPIFLRALLNTLIVGVGAAVVGALFTAVVSYVIIRTAFRGRGVMDFLSWLPWALPGVLLGLALLWVALGTPFLKVLYGSVTILILAIIISELPVGTQMLKASLMQLSRELEESAWMSGAAWFYAFRRVVLPLLLPALLAVALIFFLTAVREIPSIVFLSSFESRTLSLLMLDYIASASMEKAMVLGVFTTFLILAVAALGRVLLGMRLGSGAE